MTTYTYTYTYAIEGSDDGEIWMPEADAIGTENYDGTAQDFARTVLDNRLAEGDESGPVDQLRVVVWEGTQQDVIDMAAAVVYAANPADVAERIAAERDAARSGDRP